MPGLINKELTGKNKDVIKATSKQYTKKCSFLHLDK